MAIDLAEITVLARRQTQLEEEVACAERVLSEAKAKLKRVAMEDLPLAMVEAGLTKITLESGETIEVKLDFNVGIPEERREDAYNWLEENKLDGIIKTKVAVAFGKGGLEDAKKLQAALLKRGVEAELTREVNWQTLKATVKEGTCRPEPINFPQDLFGNSSFNKTVVKPPKGRKAE